MSIKKYRTFVKVVENKSITKAANELRVTQSSVTQLINSLEDDLAVKLINRSRGGIVLTKEGEELLPSILEVIAADDKLQAKVASLNSSPKSETIRIASFKSVAVNWLPEIIKEFKRTSPEVDFELIDAGYNNIEETLKQKQVDFGFVPLPVSNNFKTFTLYKDRLLGVCSKDNPLAKKKAIDVSCFSTEPVISLVENIDLDARNVFKSSSVKPNIRYRVNDDYAMLAMVEKDLGICIMPELILKDMNKNIASLPLSPEFYREIGIAFPDYDNASDKAKEFAAFAVNWIKQN